MFVEAESDIFKQKHYNKNGSTFEDNVMYVKTSIDVDSIALVKLIKTNK